MSFFCSKGVVSFNNKFNILLFLHLNNSPYSNTKHINPYSKNTHTQSLADPFVSFFVVVVFLLLLRYPYFLLPFFSIKTTRNTGGCVSRFFPIKEHFKTISNGKNFKNNKSWGNFFNFEKKNKNKKKITKIKTTIERKKRSRQSFSSVV